MWNKALLGELIIEGGHILKDKSWGFEINVSLEHHGWEIPARIIEILLVAGRNDQKADVDRNREKNSIVSWGSEAKETERV